MKAKVKINYRDMKGNCYEIVRIVNDLVTLRYITSKDEQILIDFTLSELEILNKGNSVQVFRNQAYRYGDWLGYCPINKGYIMQYKMPNGKAFKNLMKNPFDLNNYSTKIK